MSKTYVIYSQQLAGQMMIRGFKLHAMGRNTKYPERNVFFFGWSQELIDSINDYQAKN